MECELGIFTAVFQCFLKSAYLVGLHAGLHAGLHVNITTAHIFRECASGSNQKRFLALPQSPVGAGRKATWGRKG